METLQLEHRPLTFSELEDLLPRYADNASVRKSSKMP